MLGISERLLLVFVVVTRLHSEYGEFSHLTRSRLQSDDKGSKCRLSTRANLSTDDTCLWSNFFCRSFGLQFQFEPLSLQFAVAFVKKQ